MTDEEKMQLQTAIATMADPTGNWNYGWEMICNLAEIDPKSFTPPFRQRSAEELVELIKKKPQKPN